MISLSDLFQKYGTSRVPVTQPEAGEPREQPGTLTLAPESDQKRWPTLAQALANARLHLFLAGQVPTPPPEWRRHSLADLLADQQQLQDRLERGLALLAAAQGQERHRLMAWWDQLVEELAALEGELTHPSRTPELVVAWWQQVGQQEFEATALSPAAEAPQPVQPGAGSTPSSPSTSRQSSLFGAGSTPATSGGEKIL